MKTHDPDETRYHIHRLYVVGIVLLVVISSGISFVFFNDHPAQIDDAIYSYHLLLWVHTGVTTILLEVVAVALTYSILTGHSIRRSSITAAPLVFGIFLPGLYRFALSYLLLLLIAAFIVIVLIRRIFVRRHYSMVYDFGVCVLLITVGLLLLTIQGPIFSGVQILGHVETSYDDDATYYLATVHDWGGYYGYVDYDSRKRFTDYQLYATFRCESRFLQCTLVRKDRKTLQTQIIRPGDD